MKPVCLWSGPRNVSTALMYSFAQRTDTEVVDEPLYGHYLRVSGAEHPGRQDVLAAMDTDGDRVMARLLAYAAETDRHVFAKQMAHHLVGLDTGFLERTRNVFLIRDPEQMLPSLTKQLPHAAIHDTGLRIQWELFERLRRAGQKPAVVDSRELLLDPSGVLQRLCDNLGLAFDEAMLRWPAGARPEDGIWAPHWYDSVHRSTGFAPYTEKSGFPEHLLPLLAECRPWYERLFQYAIMARSGE